MNVIKEYQHHRNQTRLSEYLKSERGKKGPDHVNVVRLSKNILNIANTTNKNTRKKKITNLLKKIEKYNENYEVSMILLDYYIKNRQEELGETHPYILYLKSNFDSVFDSITDSETKLFKPEKLIELEKTKISLNVNSRSRSKSRSRSLNFNIFNTPNILPKGAVLPSASSMYNLSSKPKSASYSRVIEGKKLPSIRQIKRTLKNNKAHK